MIDSYGADDFDTKNEKFDRQVSERILMDMANGVIVIGQGGKLLQINDAAKDILEMKDEDVNTFMHKLQEDNGQNSAFYDLIFEAVYEKM